jgi:hypothetical protein
MGTIFRPKEDFLLFLKGLRQNKGGNFRLVKLQGGGGDNDRGDNDRRDNDRR